MCGLHPLSCLSSPFIASLSFSPSSTSNSPFFAPLFTSFLSVSPHISLSLSLLSPSPSSLPLPQSSGESNSSSYSHQQVLQLIKSRSKEQRLGILLAGQNRKDHNFINMQVYTREKYTALFPRTLLLICCYWRANKPTRSCQWADFLSGDAAHTVMFYVILN